MKIRKKPISKNSPSETAARADRSLLLTDDTPFGIKEAYIKLRTNLMFCMTADGKSQCKVFAITSGRPSEGKSLTAANIAISCAMLGKKTLLIDADLRKPTQRKLWRISEKAGLCDFLAKIEPMGTTKVSELPLSIICTGTIPPNPSELLSSDTMKSFIAFCRKTFDYVIIDTPPINTVADAQIVSTFVDGMVMVARSGSTDQEELSAAVDAVNAAGGNLCGIVLNGINAKTAKNSYKYSYKYGGKYGYKYDGRYSYSNKYETRSDDN